MYTIWSMSASIQTKTVSGHNRQKQFCTGICWSLAPTKIRPFFNIWFKLSSEQILAGAWLIRHHEKSFFTAFVSLSFMFYHTISHFVNGWSQLCTVCRQHQLSKNRQKAALIMNSSGHSVQCNNLASAQSSSLRCQCNKWCQRPWISTADNLSLQAAVLFVKTSPTNDIQILLLLVSMCSCSLYSPAKA